MALFVVGVLLAVASADGNCFLYKDSSESAVPFSTSYSQMLTNFRANIDIDGKGGIVAAPDKNTPGGSYYYHWARDGGLTMAALQDLHKSNFTAIEGDLKSYVKFLINSQYLEDPNGQDSRTEPKYMLPDGAIFTGPWCRQQNDGPGIVATALIKLADSLNSVGDSAFVKDYLWTGSQDKYQGGVIKYNLDYLLNGYNTDTCDLWEEIRDANFFWNKITMKKALSLGASFAAKMGDSDSSNAYSKVMKDIDSSLISEHWDDNNKYMFESQSRPQDGAVIVGFNSGVTKDDTDLAPNSYKIAATVLSYNNLFCSEYQINQQDSSKQIPGVLYGRYKGDTYAGGNPWQLITAALGHLFYRAAAYTKQHGTPSSDALAVWAQALNYKGLPTDKNELSLVFMSAGDNVMARLAYHLEGANGHVSEQIDKNSGFQMSANDLTWSYAEILTALTARENYLAK
jgi:glucoamylase